MNELPVRMKKEIEGNLLLNCFNIGTDSTKTGLIGKLSSQEWDQVVRQASRHGVAPLLYQYLRDINTSSSVLIEAVQRLRDCALQNALRNLLLYQNLSKVLGAFRNDRIPLIVLKGAYLAEVVYADRALRPMYDIDLLVRQADISKAEDKLQELGYVKLERPGIELDYGMHHHLRPFIKPGAVTIEVHRSIGHPSGPFDIDVAGLWERAVPVALAGVEVLVLSPEDLLLHLCVHASFDHQFLFGLRAFWDISEVIRHFRGEIDWKQLQLRTRLWGVEKYVYLTLHLAKELLEAGVPDEVLESIRPQDFNPQVIAWAKEQILLEDALILSSKLAQLWGARRLRQKIALLLTSVFPPTETMAQMYNVSSDSHWIYFYYPRRWKDLLRQYGYSVCRMLCRDEGLVVLAKRENDKTALREWLSLVQ